MRGTTRRAAAGDRASRRPGRRRWWPIPTALATLVPHLGGVSVVCWLLGERHRTRGGRAPRRAARDAARAHRGHAGARASSTRRRARVARPASAGGARRSGCVREAGERWRLPRARWSRRSSPAGTTRWLAAMTARRWRSCSARGRATRHERERDRGDHQQAGHREQPATAGGHRHDARRASRCRAGSASAPSRGRRPGSARPARRRRARARTRPPAPFWAWISRRSCSTQRGQLRRCTSRRAAPASSSAPSSRSDTSASARRHQPLPSSGRDGAPQRGCAPRRARAPARLADSPARPRPRPGRGRRARPARAPWRAPCRAREAAPRRGPRRGRDPPARPG